MAVRQSELENDLDNYEKAQEISAQKLDSFLKRLKIPKDKQNLKDYFVGLKNSFRKKEEMQVVGPGGEKETW